MHDRVAVYAGTRNLYHDMVVAAKSLLYNNGADRVVFLTEDDTFPETLPACVTCRNVSNQTIFSQDGPNYRSRWSYMVLMRAALAKLFPDLHRILHLDHDTIVRKHDVARLWDYDLSGYYFAAVEEKQIRGRQHPYYNFGVVMQNLDMMRDGTVDVIINSINSVRFDYCEQDAANSVCRRHVLELPPAFNALPFNVPQVPELDVIIKHYATRNRVMSIYSDYLYYERIPWDQVITRKAERNGIERSNVQKR